MKRKIVIDDSDEDVSLVKKQTTYTASSPTSSVTKSKFFRVYVLYLLIMPGRSGEETTRFCRVAG